MNHLSKIYFGLLISILTSISCYSQSPIDSLGPIIQPDESAVDVLNVNLKNYNLAFKKGQLIFKSNISSGKTTIKINGEDHEIVFNDGKATVAKEVDFRGGLFFIESADDSKLLYHISKKRDGSFRLKHIPLWLSILPPLVAIGLALLFKEVIVSLFTGIWTGAFIAGGMRIGSFYYFMDSFFSVIYKYIIAALNDADHLSIIIFSLLIGGMVAVISKNGGMAGVVKSLSGFAKSARSSQFITWVLGVAIFFDDYANTLIVGNTMRSVTDKFKISREKLAYIVDSTAAPVSAIAFITTWIGAELSYIADATQGLEGFDAALTPYTIFISSLKYSFYPMLTLIFILIIIYLKKDYGPMYKAEMRARTTGQVSSAKTSDEDEPNMEDLSPVKGANLNWYNAVLPVITVIVVTLIGLIDTGMESLYGELLAMGQIPATPAWSSVWSSLDLLTETNDPSFFVKLGKLIGASNSYVALLWSSFAGLLVAILLTVVGRVINLFDTMHYMVSGFKTMLPALIILTLAWSLAIITSDELHTADYLTSILKDNVSPYSMPAIIFLLAAFIAFSTGSSWSTMAILYPIAIPTTWAISQAQGLDPAAANELLFNVISIVLSASVVGDHCSPISDTTILSSLASDCNHIDHVRTQLPYALTVGFVSIIIGTLASLFGGGSFICLLLVAVSVIFLFFTVKILGKPVPEA